MRGCEKRTVYLRHADSALFEEAYFVLRREARSSLGHREMVAEAERILRGEEVERDASPRKRQKRCEGEKERSGRWAPVLAFLLGMAGSAAVFLLWL